MCSIKQKPFRQFVLIAMLIIVPVVHPSTVSADEISPSVTFTFTDNNESKFLQRHKIAVKMITESTIAEMWKLMPGLADSIHFTVLIVNRDLSIVNGASGRADRATEIEISLSSVYGGGLDKAIEDGLQVTLFHELHHTVRGWTIHQNKFGQGIDIAAINEGLADVFAEIYTGHPHSNYTHNVDFDKWAKEVLALPKDANYGDWMFIHPDGREAIGYRTGTYLVKKAMRNSGKNILLLSGLSVKEIYKLAGYTQ